MLIPNVFRLLSELEDSTKHVLEFQDLSSKIVLVQGMTCKIGAEDDETKVPIFKVACEAKQNPKIMEDFKSVKKCKQKERK